MKAGTANTGVFTNDAHQILFIMADHPFHTHTTKEVSKPTKQPADL
jgi:hypothetical protein